MDATYDFRKEDANGKYTKADRDILVKLKKKPTTWDEYKKVSKSTKSAFSHIYNVKGGITKGQSAKKRSYLNAKRTTLNTSIDKCSEINTCPGSVEYLNLDFDLQNS